MKGRSLLMAVTVLSLSACTTVYSKDHEWKVPGGLGHYTLSARMDISFLTRQITLSVNNREVLYGEGYLWSDTIDMSGSLDGFPIMATCDKNAKTCDVTIANIHAATLSF